MGYQSCLMVQYNEHPYSLIWVFAADKRQWNIYPALPDELKHDLLNPELFTQLTLDASFYVTQREELENLELHSREYIDQIHRKRIVKLNQTSQCRDT